MKKEKEIGVVTLMTELYCRGRHKSEKGGLCPDCAELLEYVKLRRSKCPHGESKPFCSNCKIHCYKPEMRERVRAVMRYAGPRIVFRHPLIAIRHLAESKKQKKQMKKEAKTNVR